MLHDGAGPSDLSQFRAALGAEGLYLLTCLQPHQSRFWTSWVPKCPPTAYLKNISAELGRFFRKVSTSCALHVRHFSMEAPAFNTCDRWNVLSFFQALSASSNQRSLSDMVVELTALNDAQ